MRYCGSLPGNTHSSPPSPSSPIVSLFSTLLYARMCVCVCENIMRCPHCPLCTCSTIHDFIFARVAPACVGIWKTPSRIYQPVSFHPAAEYHCNVR